MVFQQGMSRIVAVPDLVLPVQHLPDTVPSTAAAARQMIVQQPIGEWRKYVSDYEPLFKQIIGFSVACDDFEQLAAAFDNEVGCAIRELSRDMRDQNKNGKAFANSVDEIRDDSIFLFDECRFKTYVVGQLLEIDEESINFRLDTSDYERTAYAVLWERVRRFDVMPIGIDSYRSGLNRVWEPMYALRTALATQGH